MDGAREAGVGEDGDGDWGDEAGVGEDEDGDWGYEAGVGEDEDEDRDWCCEGSPAVTPGVSPRTPPSLPTPVFDPFPATRRSR